MNSNEIPDPPEMRFPVDPRENNIHNESSESHPYLDEETFDSRTGFETSIPRVTPRTDSRNSAIARIPNISNSINGQGGYQNISRDSTQRSRFSRVSQVTIY